MSDSSLQTVDKNALEFFKNNKVDMGDMSGQSGYMTVKIVQKGNFEELTTLDGENPKIGTLYNTVTQTAVSEILAHVMAIRVADLPGYGEGAKPKYTMLVMWWEPVAKQLFLTFINGKGLEPFWNWQSEADKLNRQFGIPAYALLTKISTVKDENKFGTFQKFKFDIARDEKGQIAVESNIDNLSIMRDLINGSTGKSLKDVLSDIIDSVNGEDSGDNYDMTVTKEKPQKKEKTLQVEDSVTDEATDIPF